MDNRNRNTGPSYVMANDFPGLEDGTLGVEIGEQMAAFRGKGESFTLVNMETGKARKIVSEGGQLLIEDKDIDVASIQRELEHYGDIFTKQIRYHFGRYSDFENGLCALSWTLHPDGQYFADEDGFGAEDCSEENVYCIINSNLEIIVPFRPMDNVKAVLQTLAEAKQAAR